MTDDTNDVGVDLESLAETGPPKDVTVAAVTEKPFDPRRAEDAARRKIGYALIFILAVIVVDALLLVAFINFAPSGALGPAALAADAKADSERLVAILNIVFGPVVTLVGSVTGFYFGAKTAQAAADAKAGT